MSQVMVDLANLTPAATLELIERLWESLDPTSVPIPPEHVEELDRRLDAPDRGEWQGISLQELRERLRGRPR